MGMQVRVLSPAPTKDRKMDSVLEELLRTLKTTTENIVLLNEIVDRLNKRVGLLEDMQRKQNS